MSLDEWVQPTTVDPEVRAHIYSLVSALGGSSVDDEGRYVLGDDALACLKDIRRWIRLHDERLNRLDVQRCLAEANLVKGDLLEILATWPEDETDNRLKARVATTCLELLVPLTWPYDFEDHQMTRNVHKHLPYLQLAQVDYKRQITHYDKAKILRSLIRVALPSMAEPRNERSARDEGIIKLVLYFFRNIAMITQPPNLPSHDEEAEISRSATIEAFHSQDVFHLLLSVSSSMGSEFAFQDVIILEILYYLLKGVDPEKLFMSEQKVANKNTEELKDLRQREKAMLSNYARHAPSRHNRFGTMIWVKRDDERMSTVSGQDMLGNVERTLQKMDKTKKWNKPKYRGKNAEEHGENDEFDRPVPLDATATKYLRSFIEDFLDSSFNPLFTHLRKAIEREAERVLNVHSRQFFYLVSWFLQAECARRAQAKQKAHSKGKNDSNVAEDDGFALVAGVLNQETFILMNRFMQRSQDDKSWQDLNAGMKCFTRILLTVQEMSESPTEDDQEIAENIQNRIFYEQSTHDRILSILRNYKTQGFGYLDACTELVHVFLRMLERYSKQNVDLQIRSRRRARRKRKVQEKEQNPEDDGGNDSEGEDQREAERVTRERKFDFAKFSASFTTQACVDTFVSFTRFYNDLNAEQLKRAHRFFYRVAFKNEGSIILFRVDVLNLFLKMVRGPEPLDQNLPIYKEWHELVRQIFRRAIKKVEERPELVIEMLFSKIPATMFFLEHGYDYEAPKRAPRALAELEVKPGLTRNEQIAVAVTALFNNDKWDSLPWLKETLKSAVEERQAWEAEHAFRRATEDGSLAQENGDTQPPDDQDKPNAPSILVRANDKDRGTALTKDQKLRLLLTLLEFQRLGDEEDPDASWIIPSSRSSQDLESDLRLVEHHEFHGLEFNANEDNPKSAEDYLRRRPKVAPPRQRAAFDHSDDSGEEEFLFPDGGPTARKSDALEELKQRRRRRRQEDAEIDEEELARRAKKRKDNDLERRRKIKSEQFVHDSDDETDDERDREFFAREEERRTAVGKNIVKALKEGTAEGQGKKRKKDTDKSKAAKKRRTSVDSDDMVLDDAPDKEDPILISIRSSSSEPESPARSGAQDEETDTPPTSQHAEQALLSDLEMDMGKPKTTPSAPRRKVVIGDEDSEDNTPNTAPVRSRPMRGGFVIDSDSD